MEFYLYNVTSVCGFTSMIIVVCDKTIILWVFPTAYKWYPVCIIHYILTTLINEQQQYERVRVDEDGDLEKSTDVTNLIVD